MSLPWFRLYRELKDDPKMGQLDDASFRVFIEAMCWACEKEDGGKTGLKEDNANWAFRRNVTDPLHTLLQVGLLAKDSNGEIFVPKWEVRQKKSDTSNERVNKHREKKRVTLHVTGGNGDCNGTDQSRVEENRGDKKESTKSAYPSLLEVVSYADGLCIPKSEAENFFNHFDSTGWIDKNGHPIVKWQSKLKTWWVTSQSQAAEKQHHKNGNYHPLPKKSAIDRDAEAAFLAAKQLEAM